MNTDMSRQTKTVFVFRFLLEIWWPTVKNDTFFCCCLKAPNMWNFVSFPAPLPYTYSFTKKRKSRYKSTKAPEKTESVILPQRKMGKKVAKQTFSTFLFCGPWGPFFPVSPSFSRIIFGVWDPKPTPTNLQPTKKSQLRSEKRKFRRPMLRSWNKWKPCIASSKPINPRPPWVSRRFCTRCVWWNVFFFWGGVWWNSKDVGVGRLYVLCVVFFVFFPVWDRCVWFKSGWKRTVFEVML